MTAEEISTRERLVQLIQEDPDIPVSELAEALDVTRQRVHQLLNALGISRPLTRGFRRQRQRMVITGGVRAAVTQATQNTVSELLVAADLMQLGHQVFLPMPRHRLGVDLITLHIETFETERIYVTTGRRRGGELVCDRPVTPLHDRLAIVVSGERPIYEPAFPEDKKP